MTQAGWSARPAAAPTDKPTARPEQAAFTPPSVDSIPDGPYGDAIRKGMAIFNDTQNQVGEYAGSKLKCSNCHLDSGRQPFAAPMWAAWVKYPSYRTKNEQINTMEDRISGCFTYSMNAQASVKGKAPPPGDDIYRYLETYFAWLATGAKVGADMPGQGYLALPKTALGYDPARGQKVYEENCASCHELTGEGQRLPNGSYDFPPLWGPNSFNWGAGMAKISNAAGFIKYNMPFGNGNSLTDQQAWDVAAYVVSHERPRDPRQTGSIEQARAAHHKSGDYYGQVVNGDLLGDGKP
ncbi:MAG: c-type cytochrome [Sphingomonadales bacterium]|nr:c-type cytochrome [Sphingomonadales bacterium]MBD3773260.1 c-type cytochrome [Paracoccaceae bacterium]